MASPTDRVYSESHEWHKVEGDTVTMGLTRYAVDQLTDVTFVEIKKIGSRVAPGASIGEVESVKTTSDVYSAAGGEIVEINKAVVDDPSLLNSDPYGKGWLAKIKVSDKGKLASCLDGAAYDKTYPAA